MPQGIRINLACLWCRTVRCDQLRAAYLRLCLLVRGRNGGRGGGGGGEARREEEDEEEEALFQKRGVLRCTSREK